MSSSPPPPSTISKSTFNAALKLYPKLVKKVYVGKLKNDLKKVMAAMERDEWRFGGLGRGGGKGEDVNWKEGLTKEDVERLVLWKITHGHSRPFLPSMVRKNDPDTTQTQTSLAASHLLASPPPISFADVRIALDHVTKLTGIGPATGTLILSIFDPEHIPFFQDEMYEWFFPGSGKLKYTLKEYEGLYDVVAAFGKRFVCKAVEVEKVAFVLGHWGMLGEEERKELEGEKVEGGEKEVEGKTEDEIQARNGRVGKKDLAKTKADVKVDPPKAEVAAKKGRKRAAKDLENTDGAPTAKRRSLRNR